MALPISNYFAPTAAVSPVFLDPGNSRFINGLPVNSGVFINPPVYVDPMSFPRAGNPVGPTPATLINTPTIQKPSGAQPSSGVLSMLTSIGSGAIEGINRYLGGGPKRLEDLASGGGIGGGLVIGGTPPFIPPPQPKRKTPSITEQLGGLFQTATGALTKALANRIAGTGGGGAPPPTSYPVVTASYPGNAPIVPRPSDAPMFPTGTNTQTATNTQKEIVSREISTTVFQQGAASGIPLWVLILLGIALLLGASKK